jgi:VRR-NUC domain
MKKTTSLTKSKPLPGKRKRKSFFKPFAKVRGNACPSEALEAELLVAHLEKCGYLFGHIPLGQHIRSAAARMRAKRAGVRPGLPDYVVIRNGRLCFIELKRLRGGRASPEQKIWVEALQQCGVRASVCCGHQAAIEWLEERST